MSKNSSNNVQFVVVDVAVPTYQEGTVTRPCTVAFTRTGRRTVAVGLAICNMSRDEFSAQAGRDIALGRLRKRPFTITTEARTIQGLEAAVLPFVGVDAIRRGRRV